MFYHNNHLNCFLTPLCPLSSSLVELTEDILKQLMDLVFTLVCNGELSLARVLRKNILDKVEQKKLLRYTNSLKPLAARGVSARYCWGPGLGSSDTSMGCVQSVPLWITDSVLFDI